MSCPGLLFANSGVLGSKVILSKSQSDILRRSVLVFALEPPEVPETARARGFVKGSYEVIGGWD